VDALFIRENDSHSSDILGFTEQMHLGYELYQCRLWATEKLPSSQNILFVCPNVEVNCEVCPAGEGKLENEPRFLSLSTFVVVPKKKQKLLLIKQKL
jgi:hypothetical protein